MAQAKHKTPRTEEWILSLRRMLRATYGSVWSVRGINGRTQLTLRYDDGTRSAVVTETPWAGPSSAAILDMVRQLHPLVMDRHLPLAEALKRATRTASSSGAGAIDWPELVAAFQAHKLESGAVSERTWRRMYQPSMARVIAAMAKRPAPRDGKALLAAVAKAQGLPPGSRGRQVALQQVAGLLRFAVEEAGVSDRWSPPTSLRTLAGQALERREPAAPIKDSELVSLLAGIEDPRTRLAVALIGCFGLRPWEAWHCRPDRGKLQILKGKRTAAGISKPGTVTGLDPAGRPGLSAETLAQLQEHGAGGLPPAPGEHGLEAHTLYNHLQREPAWKALLETAAADGRKLTPYSLRHGFALRAHEEFGLSPRVAAALMRHTVAVHNDAYGQWTDAGTVEEAIARAMTRRALEAVAS